ncbi:MAG: four helix bundle protein [Vicinamibacterales bacterium]
MPDPKPRDLCERTFLFACEIVRFCRVLVLQPGAPRQIAAQLLKAGTSIGANTEEAKVAYSRREFASKNSIVLRECHETRYWLRLLAATEMTTSEAIGPLLQESNELVAIFTVTVRRAKLPKSPSTPE